MKHLMLLAFFLIAAPVFSQKSIDGVLKKMNKKSVPYRIHPTNYLNSLNSD